MAAPKPASAALWFGWRWFGWLWFGKLTNQTNQPHECGSMVKPIKVVIVAGKASHYHHKSGTHRSAEGSPEPQP